ANRLWVTFSGYGTTKVAKWEQGQGWTLMNDNLPNVPIACIEVDTSNGMLYVGTDIGVFYRDTAMTQWEPFNNQLPSVRVNDLGINYNTHEIWAATYGRGMWRSAKQDQLSVRQLSKATEISVYPNPTKGAFSVVNKGFADKKATVQLLDNSGRVVWKQEARFNASGKMNFEVGNVARGNYVVEVIGGNDEIARQKIVLY
ncbi:MAG TPA: T9SS type A sorting domain-containing protein, partial [Flavipsychrobacter sp.]|nr:T9SS type A sorting domain-containing protein [Flavipsychrobacter sp.]